MKSQCLSFTKMRSELSEAVVQRCSVKKVFLKVLQNSKENTCARVSFLIKYGNLVVKSKLPPRSGSSLEAVEPHT